MDVDAARKQLTKLMEEFNIPPLGRQKRASSFAHLDAQVFHRYMPESQDQRHKRIADEALAKADFDGVPLATKSRRLKKKQAKMEKSQWKWGKGGWGDLKMKEKTDDDKQTLEIMSMRGSLNPQQHYKHADIKTPKFFQIGTMLDSAVDRYDRLPKKKKKKTLLDELMANEDFKRQTKKKYLEVIAQKSRKGAVYQGKAPHKIKLKKKKAAK